MVQTQIFVDLQRRRGVVECNEVQSGDSLGQQPRAEPGGDLDANRAYSRGIVLRCEDPLFQPAGMAALLNCGSRSSIRTLVTGMTSGMTGVAQPACATRSRRRRYDSGSKNICVIA
ncbi:hypothetical protein MBT84_31065 [Streptomyces sp. MBT84]|nr:hypothetical protein [Streptomyces sp. MBT84]